MLDKIPFEIKLEIMKRLPVKSLLQFRSVSKAWKSLIDSPDFIARYTALNSEPQLLLVTDHGILEKIYGIISDDYTFPKRKLILTIPQLLNQLTDDYRIIGSSNGLVCFYGNRHSSLNRMAVLWNPSIRKAVGVIVPNLGGGKGMYQSVLGFGVCGETMDPKILKITYIIDNKDIDMESVNCIPSQVEVFTLSTGVWRSPYRNLPRKSVQFRRQPQVVVDGFLYWLATDKITRDGGYNDIMSYSLIVSFDLTTEEFREVSLPDSLALAYHNNHVLLINKVKNSLVVIHHNEDVNNPVMGIWMRVDGVFTKLYDLKVNGRYEIVWGFRKNGAPIVQTKEVETEEVVEELFKRELVVYEPSSKNMDSFWIHYASSNVRVYPYMETLLLLDQPDLMVYNDI
ncbi:hypothetical protein SSX86_009816 [Deinandra increscens subsp. villosa]|uniref:F-box domain-containing protein n=1 Tax=Deinandra increscens subsp. villosa TaxID=3103831 RepID=A0AAP0H1F6_9ASTR